MVQYQSFPGLPGDSDTLAKLKALRLPPLEGKTFLDVGCNEGFFCGYAAFDGAARSVGIDHSAKFVERARARFPQCEFLHRSWDKLPDGPFDVILLASALHYAKDQEALLHALMERLTPDGTLVLELGIVGRSVSEWVLVKRGPDQRVFPTKAKVDELLAPYAYKQMGVSVAQAGDPVKRFVMHVRPRKPFAYLLMQPPAYGKSTIARTLFRPAGVQVVSGDEAVSDIARGLLTVSEELATLVKDGLSPLAIDQTLARVVEAGRGGELIRAMIGRAQGRDFALDAYLPAELHAEVAHVAREEGFLPVVLNWEPAGSTPVARVESDASAEAYFASLVAGQDAGSPARGATSTMAQPPGSVRATGFVDSVCMAGRRTVRICGWAYDDLGRAPQTLAVRLAGARYERSDYERVRRPDVLKHHPITDPLVGYELEVPIDVDLSLGELVSSLELRIVGKDQSVSAPLTLSRRILEER